MSNCSEVVNAILQELSPINAQFPLLMFSDVNCQGKRYPPEGEFNLWEQYLPLDSLGFEEIKSIYVPPQALFELWAEGGDGYYSMTGPQMVSNLSAMVAAWRNWDDSPCVAGTVNCGNRVVWKMYDPIQRMRIHRPVSWNQVLATMAANRQQLRMGTTTYDFDYDTLFQDVICLPGQVDPQCNCHRAWQEILTNHAGAAEQSFVNILQNGCNAQTQYVPSGARVGDNTPSECQQQINAQLKTGTFPTLNQGGPSIYICAGTYYLNSFEDGIVDPLAHVDDHDDDLLEEVEMSGAQKPAPAYAWWVMGSMLILGVLMIFAEALRKSTLTRRKGGTSKGPTMRSKKLDKSPFHQHILAQPLLISN